MAGAARNFLANGGAILDDGYGPSQNQSPENMRRQRVCWWHLEPLREEFDFCWRCLNAAQIPPSRRGQDRYQPAGSVYWRSPKA